MNLKKAQKKYIHKNIGAKTVDELSAELKVDKQELIDFLKKTLPYDKFQKLEDQLGLASKNKKEKEAYVEEEPKNKNKSIWKDLIENKYIILILIAIGLIIYINSLPNDFVSDDIPSIKNKPDYLLNPFVLMKYYYVSLRAILNSLLFKAFGLNPAVYRLPNVILHALNSALVFLVFNRITIKRISLLSAILFAVHPMQAEAVTWISGAPYSQSAFFLLSSFYLYLLNKTKFSYFYYISSIILFVGALYSDAKSVVVLGVFVLYEILFGNIKKKFWLFIPYLIVGLHVNFISYIDLKSRVSTLSTQYQIQSGIDNPFVQLPISLTGYFQLYLWPQYLSLYQTEITIMGTQEFVFRVIFTVIFIGLYILSFFRFKKIFFAVSIFLIAMIPYLTPFRISWYVAERYAYIGTVGIVFVFAYFYDYLFRKFKDFEYGLYTLFIVIACVLAIRTVVRNMDWKNEDVLWMATYKTSPSGYQIHNNMGDVYTRKGDYETAAKFFKNATLLKQDYAAAYHNLAITQLRLNKVAEAEENFKTALKYNPTIWQSNLNLGSIYYSKGDMENTKKYLETAYQLNPKEPSILSSLGIYSYRVGDKDSAIKYFNDALKLDPNNQAAKNGLMVIQQSVK